LAVGNGRSEYENVSKMQQHADIMQDHRARDAKPTQKKFKILQFRKLTMLFTNQRGKMKAAA
jgi:hypothetical protein